MIEIFQNQTFRAIFVGLCLMISAAPIGVFLVLRRMSLAGDALGHSILPGATIGALLSHSASWAISLGAAITGSLLFSIASRLPKILKLSEDTIFACFYLGALSLGFMIANLGENHVHLEDILFGDLKNISDFSVYLAFFVMIISSFIMRKIYSPLLFDTIEPDAFSYQKKTNQARATFYVIVTLLLVSAFQTMGTLLAIGIIITPAISAKFWAKSVKKQIFVSGLIGIIAIIFGIFINYVTNIQATGLIVFSLVLFAFFSAFFGPNEGYFARNQAAT